VGTHKKLAILKQLQTHFQAKHDKGVGTPFLRVPTPPHPYTLQKTAYLHVTIATAGLRERRVLTPYSCYRGPLESWVPSHYSCCWAPLWKHSTYTLQLLWWPFKCRVLTFDLLRRILYEWI